QGTREAELRLVREGAIAEAAHETDRATDARDVAGDDGGCALTSTLRALSTRRCQCPAPRVSSAGRWKSAAGNRGPGFIATAAAIPGRATTAYMSSAPA